MDSNHEKRQVKLLKQHEHAGRVYPPGATPTLPAGKADWLVGLKVAQEMGVEAPASTQPVDPAPDA